jgi:hypothetical protein
MFPAQAPIYNPAPVQLELHACQANEILIGGAAGPGKSLALLMDPIQTQLLGPEGEHSRWLRGEIRESIGWAIHFRREFPRLEQTIDRAHRMFKQMDAGAKWDPAKHMYTFSCGYKYQFGHIASDADRFNYLSNEYTHVVWDELWEFSEEVYQFVNTRLRTSDKVLQTKLRIVSGTNPAPNWVRTYFVDPAPEGRRLLTKKILLDSGEVVKRSRIFIPATLKDNPDADFRRRYEIELQDKPAHIRRALLYGDWYVIPGAYFSHEFTPAHVVKAFKVPSGWIRYRSMDWGYKTSGVVLWVAVDTDGDLLFYRELSFNRMDAGAVARRVRQIEEANDEWDHRRDCSRLSGPADTQIWEQRGTIGPTIAETMSLEGVDWEKATKNRHASIQQLLKRLKDRTGEHKKPAIRFFDTCKDTVRTLPSIGTDATDPELPADGGDDHWLDTVLYACMYRAAAAKKDDLPLPRKQMDELEEARQRKHRERRKGRYGYGLW